MGYLTRSGRWADTDDLVLVPEGSTGDVTGEAIELGDRAALRATVRVLELTDGGAVAVELETGETRDGPWRLVGAFEPVTAVGSVRGSFGGIDRFVRALANVAETGRVVFDVMGEAA